MENRRSLILLLFGLVALAILAPAALAYDNVGMHRTVNAAAIVDFRNNRMTARSLAGQRTARPLRAGLRLRVGHPGRQRRLEGDASITPRNILSSAANGWASGSWTAATPATSPRPPMAVRHFFDPKNVSSPFLTNEIPWDANPKMDAVSWVLTWNQNQYSFLNGKDYFAIALAGDTPDQLPYYGKAWRAVGETMHVMADLCNPAHVRNDGHPWSEPLEAVTNSSVVLQVPGLRTGAARLQLHHRDAEPPGRHGGRGHLGERALLLERHDPRERQSLLQAPGGDPERPGDRVQLYHV